MELGLTVACGLLAALTASSLARAIRLRPGRAGTGPRTVTALWGCLLTACLTAAGATGLLAGIVASAVLAVITVVALRRSHAAGAHLGAGPAYLWADAAAVAGRAWRSARQRPEAGEEEAAPLRQRRKRQSGGGAAPPAPPAAAAGPERARPALRNDPALGPPPAPEEVLTGVVVVPAPWDVLAGYLAAFHPETGNDQSAHVAGIAAGLVRIAEGIRSHAEIIACDVGLDPVYVGALLELADIIAAASGDAALVDRQYKVIYGALIADVDNGLILPYRAREFLGGDGGGGTAAA